MVLKPTIHYETVFITRYWELYHKSTDRLILFRDMGKSSGQNGQYRFIRFNGIVKYRFTVNDKAISRVSFWSSLSLTGLGWNLSPLPSVFVKVNLTSLAGDWLLSVSLSLGFKFGSVRWGSE